MTARSRLDELREQMGFTPRYSSSPGSAPLSPAQGPVSPQQEIEELSGSKRNDEQDELLQTLVEMQRREKLQFVRDFCRKTAATESSGDVTQSPRIYTPRGTNLASPRAQYPTTSPSHFSTLQSHISGRIPSNPYMPSSGSNSPSVTHTSYADTFAQSLAPSLNEQSRSSLDIPPASPQRPAKSPINHTQHQYHQQQQGHVSPTPKTPSSQTGGQLRQSPSRSSGIAAQEQLDAYLNKNSLPLYSADVSGQQTVASSETGNTEDGLVGEEGEIGEYDLENEGDLSPGLAAEIKKRRAAAARQKWHDARLREMQKRADKVIQERLDKLNAIAKQREHERKLREERKKSALKVPKVKTKPSEETSSKSSTSKTPAKQSATPAKQSATPAKQATPRGRPETARPALETAQPLSARTPRSVMDSPRTKPVEALRRDGLVRSNSSERMTASLRQQQHYITQALEQSPPPQLRPYLSPSKDSNFEFNLDSLQSDNLRGIPFSERVKMAMGRLDQAEGSAKRVFTP